MKKFHCLFILLLTVLVVNGQIDPSDYVVCGDSIVIVSDISDTTACTSDDLSLNFVISGIDFTGYTSSWYWDQDDVFVDFGDYSQSISTNTLSTSTNADISVSTTTSTSYFVRIDTNGAALCRSEVKQISILTNPIISIGTGGTVCSGGIFDIPITNNSGFPLSLSYQINSGTPITLNVPISGTDIEISGSSGSYTVDIISVSYTGDQSGCTFDLSDSRIVDIRPLPSASLNLTGQNTLCVGDELPQLELTNPNNQSVIAILNGSAVLLPPSSSTEIDLTGINITLGQYTYTLSSVSFSTGLACSNTINQNVEIMVNGLPPSPNIVDSISVQAFCAASDPNLNNLSSPEGTIRWFNDVQGEVLNGNPELANGFYFPSIQDGNECWSLPEESSRIDVVLVEQPEFSVNPITEAKCSGELFELDLSVNPSPLNLDFYCIDDDGSSAISIITTDSCSASPTNGIFIRLNNPTNSLINWDGGTITGCKEFLYTTPVSDPILQCCEIVPISPIQVNVGPAFQETENPIPACFGQDEIELDPIWNQIGNVSWEFGHSSFVVGGNVSIDNDSKSLTIDMTNPSFPILPGSYSATISGTATVGDCGSNWEYTIIIEDQIPLESKIIDDETICQNELTQIEINNPSEDLVYSWTCTNCEVDILSDSLTLFSRWIHPDGANASSSVNGSYTIQATSNISGCSRTIVESVEILPDFSSCPEGIAFFEPNGLSITDFPAEYFQWGVLDDSLNFSLFDSQTNQTYFPNEVIDDCVRNQFVVRTSLYPDKCWSTTAYCFDLSVEPPDCTLPKSNSQRPKFDVFPNPTSGLNLVVRELMGSADGEYDIALYDITGKQVFSDKLLIQSSQETLMSLPSITEGIYILRIVSEQVEQSVKLMIQP